MAINSINNNSNLSVTQLKDIQNAKVKVAEKVEVASSSAVKETVTLSNQALEKQREVDSVDQTQKTEAKQIEDTSRNDRIEALKAQIKNGEFKVDSSVIANKLTQNREEFGMLLNR